MADKSERFYWCPISPKLEDIWNRRDTAAADQIADHVGGCPHCQAEIERMSQGGWFRQMCGDFVRGLIGIAVVSLFFGMRGVTNAIRHTHDETTR